MIEAIIGRQHGTNCLLITIKGKSYPLTGNDVVPKTVSSSHCKLVVNDQGEWTLSNIKTELDTFVDGMQIQSRRITPDSHVELGYNHFVVDMHKVQDILYQASPKVFSLQPLEKIWKEYDEKKLAMQQKEMKKQSYQRLQSVLSLSGMIFAIIPQLGIFRWILLGLALLIALFFLISSLRTSNSLMMKLRALNEEFEKKYICPNPDCPRFLGYRPYNQLQFDKGCPHCQCKYTNS